ncbi:MAG: peptidase M14, partial [Candidatus Eremiobacteraeota bacterium]|nr:peptidase M14 [Candidatus Eremiobacteraeota bacterium]
MNTRTAPICLLLVFSTLALQAQPDPLKTTAEETDFRQTGRYDEMVRLCRKFEEQWPDAVRVYDFGVSPEGRQMKALVVSLSGVLEPDRAQAEQLPVVVVQGCIHAGEVDGKDAGFIALRDLLRDNDERLKKCVVVFVPIFNVDGHERFKAWNRPNQNGPEEMGWRVTSQNLNLNRDYTKADCPEMRAMLGLLNSWDP